ncbi:hypothetical protein AGABI1DRAFT_111688 [Agaricus bisporus var. burnettii JB137-S8]|uniref:Uncharacterized protein n=1 Tax=Agaricus bisporus var. burnettii (strain JB137-S8 / ATCC MYA-4627 / FGSC 10392) TaxID=597362 RepID=K5XIC6_AGABU|nr:uncharacterized protein AGABI1DRAFT_111688 [Agaricus bisporus var. burnettii JB137-S8]EKM83238.1 hypothetical protein AGABI1DRAFT_111688 [Agaricus bisporus var. burnettii JB137-S8]
MSLHVCFKRNTLRKGETALQKTQLSVPRTKLWNRTGCGVTMHVEPTNVKCRGQQPRYFGLMVGSGCQG